MKITADFPGGNIIVDEIKDSEIYLHQDLRTTQEDWFYWCFEVQSPEKCEYSFSFTKSRAIGVLGAAVSLDQGTTWKWLGANNNLENGFSYKFTGLEKSVRFSFAMPYQESNLNEFILQYSDEPLFNHSELGKTKKGRSIDLITIGDINSNDVIILTARSHSCEMMASYVLEGIIENILSFHKDYLKTHAFLIVPFMDKDGVEDGDQGKARAPHDHNRDFGDKSIHPSVIALKKLIDKVGIEKIIGYIDIHCPHISGDSNELIYLAGSSSDKIAAAQVEFCNLLEKHDSPLPFKDGYLPFGTAWNVGAGIKYQTGSSWAAGHLPNAKLATTIEVPYANASGTSVTQKSAKAFGVELGDIITRFFV
jgi:hypothetical protein